MGRLSEGPRMPEDIIINAVPHHFLHPLLSGLSPVLYVPVGDLTKGMVRK